MAFIESPRFPDCISFGAVGGPMFFTEVVTVASGHEQRNEVWEFPRLGWDVSQGVRKDSDMHQLIAFFRIAKGRTNGFRYKDWSDYQTSAGGDGIIGTGIGTGLASYQLMKRYILPEVPSSSYGLRQIRKPISGTVQVFQDAVELTSGFGIDYTSGIITFAASATATVTNVTKANPAVVTFVSTHPFILGQSIIITGSVGMPQINGQLAGITALSPTTVTLGAINSTSYGTFTGTATASRYPQPGNALTWIGEFDTPCRFDVDEMKIGIINKQGANLLENWESIPVIELRQS